MNTHSLIEAEAHKTRLALNWLEVVTSIIPEVALDDALGAPVLACAASEDRTFFCLSITCHTLEQIVELRKKFPFIKKWNVEKHAVSPTRGYTKVSGSRNYEFLSTVPLSGDDDFRVAKSSIDITLWADSIGPCRIETTTIEREVNKIICDNEP